MDYSYSISAHILRSGLMPKPAVCMCALRGLVEIDRPCAKQRRTCRGDAAPELCCPLLHFWQTGSENATPMDELMSRFRGLRHPKFRSWLDTSCCKIGLGQRHDRKKPYAKQVAAYLPNVSPSPHSAAFFLCRLRIMLVNCRAQPRRQSLLRKIVAIQRSYDASLFRMIKATTKTQQKAGKRTKDQRRDIVKIMCFSKTLPVRMSSSRLHLSLTYEYIYAMWRFRSGFFSPGTFSRIFYSVQTQTHTTGGANR